MSHHRTHFAAIGLGDHHKPPPNLAGRIIHNRVSHTIGVSHNTHFRSGNRVEVRDVALVWSTTNRVPNIRAHILTDLVKRFVHDQHIALPPGDYSATNVIFQPTLGWQAVNRAGIGIDDFWILQHQQTERISNCPRHTIRYYEWVQGIAINSWNRTVRCEELPTTFLRVTVIAGNRKLAVPLIRIAVLEHIQWRINQPESDRRSCGRRIAKGVAGDH